LVGNIVKNKLRDLTLIYHKIFRYILEKNLCTKRKLLKWKELIKNIEFDKSIENLESTYPKANYFIAKIILSYQASKIQILKFHKY